MCWPEEPEQAPPSPIYIPFVPEPVYPEFLPVDDEVFPAEEQPLPAADSPTHQSPGYIPESDPEEDLEEDDEEDPEEDPADYPADRGDDDDAEDEHLVPVEPAAVAYSADQDPYIAYRATARMSIRTQAPTPFLSEEVAERVLALPTPPPSPLSPYSSPLPHIPSPPLPIPPPISPTYVEGSLGSRAAGIRRRDALPSHVHDTEIPEMWLPLRKRLCRTTPGPRCEVGESSAAGAARQFGPTTARADLYGFADTLEAAPGRPMSRELGYGIRDTWDDLVGAIQEIAPTTLEGVNQRVIELSSTVDEEDEIIYSQLDDARYDRALLRARVNMLESDRPFHGRTAVLMEEEARLSRAAWAQSMDACDQTHSEGILLRTTVMTQQSEIVELRAADQRRQTVISELLKADYRRQRQLVETLKIVKSLKAQMIEIQRQQGPAKDPAEPELPEEAASRLYRSFVLTSYSSNDILRNQTTLKGERNISVLVSLSLLFTLYVAAVYWLFGKDDVIYPLVMLSPKTVPPFWQAIFIIVVNGMQTLLSELSNEVGFPVTNTSFDALIIYLSTLYNETYVDLLLHIPLSLSCVADHAVGSEGVSLLLFNEERVLAIMPNYLEKTPVDEHEFLSRLAKQILRRGLFCADPASDQAEDVLIQGDRADGEVVGGRGVSMTSGLEIRGITVHSYALSAVRTHAWKVTLWEKCGENPGL
ncbi:hypothetical protein Tco_1578096 [Tanacetum coccineum]